MPHPLRNRLLSPGSFFAVHKPVGMTSYSVVNQVTKVLKQFVQKNQQNILLSSKTKDPPPKFRCGHLGTLDPNASGVLPMACGFATRFINYAKMVPPNHKVYTTTITLGKSTSTDDQDTDTTNYRVIREVDMSWLTREHVELHLKTFIGDIEQRPPTISAKRIDGVRAHELERKGLMTGQLSQPVQVRVDDLELLSFKPGRLPEIELKVTCGPGTYVRSIARDLGQQILHQNLGTHVLMEDGVWFYPEYVPGCGAVKTLRRDVSNGFQLEQCIELEEFLDVFGSDNNNTDTVSRVKELVQNRFQSVFETMTHMDVIRFDDLKNDGSRSKKALEKRKMLERWRHGKWIWTDDNSKLAVNTTVQPNSKSDDLVRLLVDDTFMGLGKRQPGMPSLVKRVGPLLQYE